MRILLALLFVIMALGVYAQNPINLLTQTDVDSFLIKTNTIANDADTASFEYKRIGVRVISEATNSIFEWTGSKWVSGGKVYSVANQSDLAELPCPPNNWAYVSGENSWYYCDGSEWVENSLKPSNLAQEGANNNDAIRWNSVTGTWEPAPVNSIEYLTNNITYYVCNDTCEYNSLGKALTAASFFSNVGDTSGISSNNVTINIVRNGDGTKTLLDESISFTGLSLNSTIISTTDTVIVKAKTGATFLALTSVSAPQFKNCVFEADTTFAAYGTYRFIVATYCSSVNIDNVEMIGFQRGFQFQFTNSNISNSSFSKISRNIVLNANSRIFNTSFNDNLKTPFNDNFVEAIQSANVSFLRCTSDSTSEFLITAGSRVSFDDCGEIEILELVDQGQAFLVNGTTLKQETTVNKLTENGLIVVDSRPFPFGEYSSAQEPAASSGIRTYWNTDDNEYKVSPDGLNWEPLVPQSSTEVCKTDGNPNLIPELETVDVETECVIARDTTNNITYEYDASLSVGSRWRTINVNVYEITTVGDTTSITSPKIGDYAITTGVCATRLVYTGTEWNILTGVVNTDLNVLSSSYIGSETGVYATASFSITQTGVDSVVLESFKVNSTEVLSERYRYISGGSCSYADLGGLIDATAATSVSFADSSSCVDTNLINMDFEVVGFDSIEYVVNVDGTLDTTKLFTQFFDRDTFQVVLTAASVSQVQSISDNNAEIDVFRADSVLTVLKPSNSVSGSVTVNFTFCNNETNTLPLSLNSQTNQITVTVPSLTQQGTVGKMAVYSDVDVLSPSVVEVTDTTIKLPRHVRITPSTVEPAAQEGLLYYNSSEDHFKGNDGVNTFFLRREYRNNSNASQFLLSGDNNSGGIGLNAQQNLSGDNNSGGIGLNAQRNLSGDNNAGGIGINAQQNLSGNNNAGGIGVSAQRDLLGTNNSGGIGHSAQRNLSGSNNSGGIGYFAQQGLSGGFNAGGIGYESQQDLSGNNNSGGIGYRAQRFFSGNNNSGGIGYESQRFFSGNNNSGGIGYRAQSFAVQDNSIAIGYDAGNGLFYPVTGIADTVPRTNINISANTISGVNTSLFGSVNDIVLLNFQSERGDSLNFSGTRQATITSSSVLTLNRDVTMTSATAIDATDLYIRQVAQYNNVTLLGDSTIADKTLQAVIGSPSYQEVAFGDREQRLRIGQDITGRDGQAWRLNESTGQMELQADPLGFQTFTTAQQPVAEEGRAYYNSDDQEVKISKDGLTFEPLVPKDTIIHTFAILPYNGTDTIADQIGFEEYFTTITPDWANRKVVAFEITTTDTVSTDLYLQLYQENIVAGTSAIPIPPTTNFVLPQGQQSIRFTTADTEIPVNGIEFTLGRAVYAAVTNGLSAGSTSYIATEGANGLYITFYLIN